MEFKMIKRIVFLTAVLPVFWVLCQAKQSGESNYTGSSFGGNYVWSAAMNLAWNELNDNILGEKLKLRTRDKEALKTAEKLNKAVFSKDDLDEEN